MNKSQIHAKACSRVKWVEGGKLGERERLFHFVSGKKAHPLCCQSSYDLGQGSDFMIPSQVPSEGKYVMVKDYLIYKEQRECGFI